MRFPSTLAAAALIATTPAAAQTAAPSAMTAAPGMMLPAGQVLVEEGTLVRLMVTSEVSTRTAHAGDRFQLRVDEPVVVDGVEIVPVGAKATAEVLSAEGSGAVGKSGKLSANLLYVDVPAGRLSLRGRGVSQAGGGTQQAVLGVLSLGALGLLARGNNARLKAGDIINGEVAVDYAYDGAQHMLLPVAVPSRPVFVPAAAR